MSDDGTGFAVRWPDGSDERCLTASPAVRELLVHDACYPVAEFVDLSRAALMRASQQVERRWGFPCPQAHAQLAALEQHAALFDPDAPVRVLHLP